MTEDQIVTVRIDFARYYAKSSTLSPVFVGNTTKTQDFSIFVRRFPL
jgi:hypothetical protein